MTTLPERIFVRKGLEVRAGTYSVHPQYGIEYARLDTVNEDVRELVEALEHLVACNKSDVKAGRTTYHPVNSGWSTGWNKARTALEKWGKKHE